MNQIRKWLAIGTGAGIEIGETCLRVTIARVRPSGVRVLGQLTVERFRERPAAEWGAEYSAFLKKTGGNHLAASVLLPRRDVIVRQIALPGVENRDLGAAIQFQIDSLHPYPDGEAAYDWARIGGSTSILIGITRRSVVEHYATLLTEAGIQVAGFTFSAAALYSAARLLSDPPPEGFLAFEDKEGELEVYGESPARPVFSAAFESDRGLDLALAELRLPPETEPIAISRLLPSIAESGVPPLPLATALAGACPRLALSLNLLPPEQRQSSSRLLYVPTLVLASLLLLTAGALAARSTLENRRYLATLQAEIAKLEPRARRVDALDKAAAAARNRTQLLDQFKLRTRADMEALDELTKLLPPPAWVNSLQLVRSSIAISGEAEQPAVLLKTLDASPHFKNSDFTMPLQRLGPNREGSRIQAARQGTP